MVGTSAAADKIEKSSARTIDNHLRKMFDALVARPVPTRLKLVAEQLALAETPQVHAVARKQ
jgi:hypothetical protein